MQAINELTMAGTRECLASSAWQRQRAVAEFPLRVASAAAAMKKLCDLRDSGVVMSDNAESAIDYLEQRIRICYRETFGTELGESANPSHPEQHR